MRIEFIELDEINVLGKWQLFSITLRTELRN